MNTAERLGLTWLYLSGFIALAGGELNVIVEHRADPAHAPPRK